MAAANSSALEETTGQRAGPGNGPEAPGALSHAGRPVHSDAFSSAVATAASLPPATAPPLHTTSASTEQQRPSSGLADNIRRVLTTQVPGIQRLIAARRSSRRRRGTPGRLPADVSAHAVGALPPHPTINTYHRRGSVASLLGAGDAASSRAGDLSVHSCATTVGGLRRSLFTIDGLPEPVAWGPDVSIISIQPVGDAVPAEPYLDQHVGVSDLADYPGAAVVGPGPASGDAAVGELPPRQQLAQSGAQPGSSTGTGGVPLQARTPHSSGGYQPQPGSSSGVDGLAGPVAHSASAAGGDAKNHSSAMHPYLAVSGVGGPVDYRLAASGRGSASGQPASYTPGGVLTHTHTSTTATPSGPGSSALLQPHGPDSDVPLGRASWGELVMQLNCPESAASGASPPFPSGASPPIPSGAQPSSYQVSEVGASPLAGAGGGVAGGVPGAVRRLAGPVAGAGEQAASGAGAAAGAGSAFGKHQQQQQAQEAGVSAGPESGLQQQQHVKLVAVGALAEPSLSWDDPRNPMSPSYDPSLDEAGRAAVQGAVPPAAAPAVHQPHHHQHHHAPALHVHFPEGYPQQHQQQQQCAPGDLAPQSPVVTVQLREPGKGNTTGSVHAGATYTLSTGAPHPTATATSAMAHAPYAAVAAGTDPLSRVPAAAKGTPVHTPSRQYTGVSAGGAESVHSRPAGGLATDSIQSRATTATGAATAGPSAAATSVRPDGSCRRMSRSRHSDVARISRMTDGGAHIVVLDMKPSMDAAAAAAALAAGTATATGAAPDAGAAAIAPPKSLYGHFIDYCTKWKGVHDTMMPPDAPLDIAWSWLGAFLSILVVAILNQYLSPHVDTPLMIASFGASAVLLFGVPASKLGQPRNFVGGQVLSAFVGVIIRLAFRNANHLVWLSSALGMSLALAVMQVTRTVHPPGGASALIAASLPVIGDWHGFRFLLTVFFGSMAMLVVALVVNNLSSRRRYPTYWVGK